MHLVVGLAAMAVLHDRHARVLVLQEFALGACEDFGREPGGAGVEVGDSRHEADDSGSDWGRKPRAAKAIAREAITRDRQINRSSADQQMNRERRRGWHLTGPRLSPYGWKEIFSEVAQ